MPSTFNGHALPGTFFILVGAAKIFILMRRGDDRVCTMSPRTKQWHRFVFLGLFLAIVVASHLVERPEGVRIDWYPSSHKAMYMTMLPVTLASLGEDEAWSEKTTLLCLASGMAMESLLFHVHAQMKFLATDAACHEMLRDIALFTAILSLFVALHNQPFKRNHPPDPNVLWMKMVIYLCLMLHGIFFYVTALILFAFPFLDTRMEVFTLFVLVSSGFMLLVLTAGAGLHIAKKKSHQKKQPNPCGWRSPTPNFQ